VWCPGFLCWCGIPIISASVVSRFSLPVWCPGSLCLCGVPVFSACVAVLVGQELFQKLFLLNDICCCEGSKQPVPSRICWQTPSHTLLRTFAKVLLGTDPAGGTVRTSKASNPRYLLLCAHARTTANGPCILHCTFAHFSSVTVRDPVLRAQM